MHACRSTLEDPTGGFVIRERIGEGGFGAVYRATQPALDREAVVKVLHQQLHASKAATERFLREAKLASKLDHPYAAHIYAFGAESDGELWIAMELVRGTPLDRVLAVQGKLPLERFVPLLDRICEVVHTAHEQGIVHRDIKPANVMVLSRAGRLLPKLLDFGIAKGLASSTSAPDMASSDTIVPALPADVSADLSDTLAASGSTQETGQDLELTQRGAVMGSPHYMAPEQWIDAGEVDARTDLYALGVLAYECLTGSPPFTGKSVTAIAQAHATLHVPPLGPKFPAALDRVFQRVLAKHPNERYPDVLAFVTAFRAAASVAGEAMVLPLLDAERRDTAMKSAPQPIAEAVAALESPRNAHQARDAIGQLVRTVTRYLGVLAIACRSRVSAAAEPPGVVEMLRSLSRRSLSDKEWLELAVLLTRPWLDRRDAYPVPELVDACHGEHAVTADLVALIALRERETSSEDVIIDQLATAIASLSRVLDGIEFVSEYPLVVQVAPGVAERWTGVRRPQRATVPVSGKGLPIGSPALLDESGTPVLVLAPLAQVSAPAPGAPAELFWFDGRDERGAKLVALPASFEHHDQELWDWYRGQLSGTLDDERAAHHEERAPYRGLSAFSPDDGALFFGRERQIDAFVNRLQLQPLLAVVGPSGAGKSSFVYAGVVPALKWRAISMRPGPSPLGALAARLEHAGIAGAAKQALVGSRETLGELLRAEAAARGPILLVVDQLEEMFTLCHDADERRAFAEALAAAARSSDDPVRVIFTLRDDFLVRTEQVPALKNRIGQGLQLLTAPGPDDLQRIVTEPARRAGYELEGELASDMVREVADEPGALALISFTAQKLWELRDRHFKQLTRGAYKTLGGVGGALAHHADVTLDAMPPEERAVAREAFRHLVTSENTRAVQTGADLRQLLGGGGRADAVIEKLIAARLVVATENDKGAETIEIVHEALLVAWPRLVEWRREDGEGARFREQLRAAVEQWQERGNPKGLLWRGDALADLARWRARQTGPLTDSEAAFADASAADVARGRRNLRIAIAGAFVTLVAVMVVLFVSRTRIADEKHAAVEANAKLETNLRNQWESQGRLYILADDPLRGLAALAYAAKLGETGGGHDFLVATGVRATDGALFTLHHSGPVRSPQFSHDGTRLATGGLDGKARIFNAASGKQELELPHSGMVIRIVFAPDDASVLTASLDGSARWWDAKTGALRAHFDHGKPVWCAQFSPDGQLAITASEDGSIAAWQLRDGALRWRGHGDGAGLHACAVSPDGRFVAAGDRKGTVRVWDAKTGALLHTHADQHDVISMLKFSRDGALFIAASDDHTAVVWKTEGDQALYKLVHDDAVYSAEISPDGKSALTGSIDKSAVVWDLATGHRTLVLGGHSAGVTRATYSPDGDYIGTSSEDATARLWDAASGRSLAHWRGHDGYIMDAAFDPRGHRFATASNDQTVIVWDVRPQLTEVAVHAPPGTSTARWSRDGSKIAVGNNDGTVRIYDASAGLLIATISPPGSQVVVVDVAFDSSGRVVTVGYFDSTVRVWDLHDLSRPRLTLAGGTSLQHMECSRDGAWIATGGDDGYVRVWNAATGARRLEKLAREGTGVEWITFDPTSTSLAVVTYDGTTRTWDLDGKELASVADPDVPWSAIYDPAGARLLSYNTKRTAKIKDLTGRTAPVELDHVTQVNSAAWSPDGRLVLTASLDGNAHLWDAEHGDELVQFPQSGKRLVYVGFAPDGRFLVAGDDGTTVVRTLPHYDGAPDELTRLVRCRIPFEVRNERLELRTRDRDGCDAL